MADVQKILESHSSSTPSKWRENAEWRKTNRKWLKRSQQVAMTVLDCMDRTKMSQKELAQKMNVSPQYVSKLLKGCENLSLETISKLEEILNINILVIQNFNIVPYDSSVVQWERPKFRNLQQSKECNQLYKQTAFTKIISPKKIARVCMNYSA